MKNIFVGNLDFGATEDGVRSLFEAHGTVQRVSIKTDRDTGRSRGFAFVEMPNESEAERAISALNGTQFGGRALNVNEARPKTEGGGGGRGFGGGGAGRGGFGGGGGGYGGDRDRGGHSGGGGHGGGGGRSRREPRY
jgi:cold-inducible RNA-binding protein